MDGPDIEIMSFRNISVIARFTMIEALRTRYAPVLLIITLLAFGLAQFLSQVAITETAQLQSAIVAAALRFSAVFLVALYIVTSISREFSDKVVELMFSLPMPRSAYYLGKLVGYALLAVATAAVFTLLLSIFTPWFQALLWGLSLVLELFIICAISLLLVMAFNQVTPAFSAVVAFYLLARSISSAQLMARGPLVDEHSMAALLMSYMIDGIAFMLPDLSLFTRTEWLLYPAAQWSELIPLLGQTAVYTMLLSGVALFDLYRRNI